MCNKALSLPKSFSKQSLSILMPQGENFPGNELYGLNRDLVAPEFFDEKN